jgi:hypothetical protein
MLRERVLPRTIAGLLEGTLRIFNAKEASTEVKHRQEDLVRLPTNHQNSVSTTTRDTKLMNRDRSRNHVPLVEVEKVFSSECGIG